MSTGSVTWNAAWRGFLFSAPTEMDTGEGRQPGLAQGATQYQGPFSEKYRVTRLHAPLLGQHLYSCITRTGDDVP